MKKLLFIALGFLGLSVYAAYADVGARHIEQAGGFSLQAPKGWQFREFPGLKYQIAFGPAENQFSPNINVVDEMYAGSLKSYVDANIKSLERVFVEFKIIKRGAFVTASGIKGEKLITTSLQQRSVLRQTFYFIPGVNGKHFVVTCSVPAEGGESRDSLFEESVKTFEIM